MLQKLLDCVDHFHSLGAPAHPNGQADSAVIIHHLEDLERKDVHRLAELEVDGPHVVGDSALSSTLNPLVGLECFRLHGRGRCSPSSRQSRCTRL